MLDARAEKMQVQRGNQRREERGDSREDDGKPCWFCPFREERKKRQKGEQSRGERKWGTERRGEARGGADTQAMQDAQTRDKRQEIISET